MIGCAFHLVVERRKLNNVSKQFKALTTFGFRDIVFKLFPASNCPVSNCQVSKCPFDFNFNVVFITTYLDIGLFHSCELSKMADVMELIKSSRGGDVLCLDGYTYSKKKVSTNQIRWQCTKQRSEGCKGCVTTDINPFGNPRSFTPHRNHVSDNTRVEISKFRSEVKTAAKNTPGLNTQLLLVNSAENLSPQAIIEMGNVESIKRDIRRQKRKTLPQEPQTLPDKVMQHPFTSTIGMNPQQFMIYDSGIQAGNNRMLIFASYNSEAFSIFKYLAYGRKF